LLIDATSVDDRLSLVSLKLKQESQD